MKASLASSVLATAVVSISSIASGLNIIVSNDDGFGSANIREFYKALKAAGHNAWIVAPVVDMSGKGGTEMFTTSPNLTTPSEYNIVPAGAPSFGTDPHDSHIWYYNGTPATCTFFALDYVVKNFWNGTQPDLLVSGPNEGANLGPFLYTLSGTMGATYAAVERGIPAIAFSATVGTKRSYTYVNASTPGGKDPATITGELGTQLVNQLASNAKGGRLLPYGYGISVNYPEITSLSNKSCIDPPFIQTRLTSGAEIDNAVFNKASGLFTYGSISPDQGLNTCINGDCSLPGETNVVKKCQSSVSVFTTDYDAPNCQGSQPVRNALMPLVKPLNQTTNATSSGSPGRSSNSTAPVGGSKPSGGAGNSTAPYAGNKPNATSTSSSMPKSTGTPGNSGSNSTTSKPTPAPAPTPSQAAKSAASGLVSPKSLGLFGLVAVAVAFF